jgi:hypothetical protein
MVNVRVRRRSASEDKTQNGSDRSGKALDESHLVLKLKYAENDAEYKKGSSETD